VDGEESVFLVTDMSRLCLHLSDEMTKFFLVIHFDEQFVAEYFM